MEVINYIDKFLRERKIKKNDLKNVAFREIRNELLIELGKNADLSLRKIGEMTGINRETVRMVVLSTLSREPSPRQ